jgi:prepilin-type processing-associated H-X9-DG protein
LMIPLNNQQKQLLFDYCVGLTSETESAEAEQLISSHREAADIHAKIKAALSPLDSLEAEPCPDELAEGTIQRLNSLSRSSQFRLQQLLAVEQARGTAKSGFWRNFGEVAAVAAVILFVALVSTPTLRRIREESSRRQRCQMQLSRIFQGIRDYSSDHDGKLPAVATATGAPWWKVGYQGQENHSNTRHVWLLVKGGYVDADEFVCPGRKEGLVIQFSPAQVSKYNDFPARENVTYSFRIMCSKSQKGHTPSRRALTADLSPLFERLPKDYSKPFLLQLNKELLGINSNNHGRRGQNVMFCDGSVEFVKQRNIGVLQDDIFTLRDTQVYRGCEVPSCETDAFLAP